MGLSEHLPPGPFSLNPPLSTVAHRFVNIWKVRPQAKIWLNMLVLCEEICESLALIVSRIKTRHYKTEYYVVVRGHEYLIRNCFVTYESFDNDYFSYTDHENFNGVSLYVTSQHVKIRVKGIMQLRNVLKIPHCRLCIENCCVLQHIEVGWKMK